ncbi:MAG: hypothetical protein AAF585_07435 [Verrucomicrobiota bacterium]
MSESEAAAEHLRVIRALMERATVYRAISAPTALVGGILAIGTSALLYFGGNPDSPKEIYYALWILVLGFVSAFNTVLLWRDAKQRGAPMITASLRHAVRSLAPPLFVGGVLSSLTVQDSVLICTLIWVIFYGLALVATHSFAPRSMKMLGAIFILTGLGIWSAAHYGIIEAADNPRQHLQLSAIIMALTFGLYHIVYAIMVGVTTRFRISKRPAE